MIALGGFKANDAGAHIPVRRWAACVAMLFCALFVALFPIMPCNSAYAADNSSASIADREADSAGSLSSSAAYKSSEADADATAGEPDGADAAATSSEDQPKSEVAAADEAQAPVQDASANGDLPWPWVVFIVCVALSAIVLGVAVGILKGYRNR